MFTRKKILGLIPLCALLTIALSGDTAKSPSEEQQVVLQEAEILIYIMPDSQEVRKQGWDVGWELQTSPELNQEDFFVFWVVNAKRPNVQGSVTIGYYGINKHTADIWEDNFQRFVSGKELEGVQNILRRAHHIDQTIIEKYRSRRPFTSAPPSRGGRADPPTLR